MTTVLGVDYAWQHPSPASLAAAGYRFACRYLSRDPSKNLSLTEAQDLAAHGISVVANWEYSATAALGGRPAGIADATLALAQATAAGMPTGRPIYVSVDWDVTPAQEPLVTAYLQGWDSVLGDAQVGEYAGFYPIKLSRALGSSTWSWQTRAWSGAQWDAHDQIRQTGTAMVGGVSVDVNEAVTTDFGQWMPGQDTDIMQLTDPLKGYEARETTVGDALADLLNDRDWRYGLDTANPPPAGSHEVVLQEGVAAAAAQTGQLVTAVATLTARVGAISTGGVDPAAVAAALAANGEFVQELAAALAARLGTDITRGAAQ